jgi:Immunity protein 74
MSPWKITKEGLQNDSGGTVQFVNRSSVQYRQGERTLTLEVEYTGKDIVYVSLKDVAHWDAPDDGVMIDAEQKQRIRGCIQDAFQFEELKAKFDD